MKQYLIPKALSFNFKVVLLLHNWLVGNTSVETICMNVNSAPNNNTQLLNRRTSIDFHQKQKQNTADISLKKILHVIQIPR